MASAPIRLLVVGDAGSPHTQRFCRFFAGEGCDVHLLSHRPKDLPGVTLHVPEPAPAPLDFVPWIEIAQRTVREVAPDLLHGHYASIHGLYAALTGFHPFVLTIWGSDVNVDPHLDTRYGNLVRYALRQADFMTGHAEDLIDNARRLAGFPLARIHQMRFGVDPEDFRPGLDAAPLRERYDIPAGARVVFSPRQFKRPANIHRLLEAAPLVLERVPGAIFVLMTLSTGNDPYRQELLDLIDRLGLGEAVRIVEDVPHAEMPLWFALASVTLSIRDVDAASVTVMESLAAGVPVVASDIPSNHELIDAACGVLVDPHDVAALAGAILLVLDDPAAAAAMGMRGRGKMLEMADHRRHLARVGEFYRELLAAPPERVQADPLAAACWLASRALRRGSLRGRPVGDRGGLGRLRVALGEGDHAPCGRVAAPPGHRGRCQDHGGFRYCWLRGPLTGCCCRFSWSSIPSPGCSASRRTSPRPATGRSCRSCPGPRAAAPGPVPWSTCITRSTPPINSWRRPWACGWATGSGGPTSCA